MSTRRLPPEPIRKVAYDRLEAAIHRDEMIGFCLGCGAETEGEVEPDARRYPCHSCGERRVYGAQEIVIMDVNGSHIDFGGTDAGGSEPAR